MNNNEQKTVKLAFIKDTMISKKTKKVYIVDLGRNGKLVLKKKILTDIISYSRINDYSLKIENNESIYIAQEILPNLKKLDANKHIIFSVIEHDIVPGDNIQIRPFYPSIFLHSVYINERVQNNYIKITDDIKKLSYCLYYLEEIDYIYYFYNTKALI